MSFQLDILLNNLGIILEIDGFGIILWAIRMIKDERRGSFTSKWDMAGNIMSTLHPKWNRVGISLVIAGLFMQLISSLYR